MYLTSVSTMPTALRILSWPFKSGHLEDPNPLLYRFEPVHWRVQGFLDILRAPICSLFVIESLPSERSCRFLKCIHSLKLTAKAPENRPSQKETRKYSKHPFSGANLLSGPSGSVPSKAHELSSIFLAVLGHSKLSETSTIPWESAGSKSKTRIRGLGFRYETKYCRPPPRVKRSMATLWQISQLGHRFSKMMENFRGIHSICQEFSAG